MAVDWMRTYANYGVLDPSSEEPGFGQCLWNVEAHKQCKKFPRNGAQSLIQVFEKARDNNRERKCVGWREQVKVHQVEENGKTFEKIELKNEYEWMTYQEYYDRTLNLARGLASIGVEEKSKIVIYAETQRDWMTSAFAAWYSNAQVVTIYATLGEEGAIHGINETEATHVVADAKLLKIVAKILPKCKSVKHVITMTAPDATLAGKIKDAGSTIQSIEDLVSSGKTFTFSPKVAQPGDDAIIMYTSGTTGTPKGVRLTHGNVVACIAGVEHAMAGAITNEDTYMCYLPLAHIMELAAEVCFMSLGLQLGYGSPHTLTDKGVKLKRPESQGDAPLLAPTAMVFAPAVLDKIYQSVQGTRSELTWFKGKMFDWGMDNGEKRFDKGKVGANWFFDATVFKKVQGLVGGRIKCMITGSAPLSPDIQRFIQTALAAPVRQGYGLTETCAGSCIGFWGDNATGDVGPPTTSAVIRLADWAEGNYMNSDKDKPEIGMRRGEILIGGPCVSPGYYINPKSPNAELQTKNKEDWVEIKDKEAEGGKMRFFRTGDVGQILPNGCLQIIDRKKDLWKGPNGEYVALTKVEAALKLCEFVDMPMVYGKTGGEYPVALIVPQKGRLLALGTELKLGAPTFEELCKNDQVIQRVTKACQEQCKFQKLLAFEIPTRFALIAEPWTPENDLLTAAMKLKRPLIAEKHKAEITELYTKPPPAPAAATAAPKKAEEKPKNTPSYQEMAPAAGSSSGSTSAAAASGPEKMETEKAPLPSNRS